MPSRYLKNDRRPPIPHPTMDQAVLYQCVVALKQAVDQAFDLTLPEILTALQAENDALKTEIANLKRRVKDLEP